MRYKNISKALDLLEQFEQFEHNKTDDVHWVEDSNGNSDWGDFCGDCVDGVLKTVRKDYLQKQRKLPISERDEQCRKFEAFPRAAKWLQEYKKLSLMQLTSEN